MNKRIFAAIVAAGMVAGSPALADNAMQVCGAKYQAAKTAKTLPAGQTWNQFLAQCRTTLPKTAAVAAAGAPPAAAGRPIPATPAASAVVAKSARAQSPAMAAVHDRQRQCGAQWKADKAAGKIPAGQTWPKYWSACNTRLKG
jgi:hypothetical protein